MDKSRTASYPVLNSLKPSSVTVFILQSTRYWASGYVNDIRLSDTELLHSVGYAVGCTQKTAFRRLHLSLLHLDATDCFAKFVKKLYCRLIKRFIQALNWLLHLVLQPTLHLVLHFVLLLIFSDCRSSCDVIAVVNELCSDLLPSSSTKSAVVSTSRPLSSNQAPVRGKTARNC